MNTSPNLSESHPPKLIPTLLGGFNLVASNIGLILLPVLVDLGLWLGPKIKISQLLASPLQTLGAMLSQAGSADLQAQSKTLLDSYNTMIGQFNLAVALRTFPVGIPSLISRLFTSKSPLAGVVYEIPSEGIALLILGVLTIVGFLLGSIYFNALARYSAKPVDKFELQKFLNQYGQSLVMFLILAIVMMIILIPGISLLSIFMVISPSLGQFIIMLSIVVLLWLIVPLVFAPHSLFVLNQKAFPSILLSLRMVRFFLPGTGLFVVTAALISEGMNLVWELADPTSWLTLVSIAGHAFIVTALLAASFIYYRDGLRWMQDNIQRMSNSVSKTDIGGPFGTTRQ